MAEDSHTAVHLVRGMTCSHCVQSVSAALLALPEVASVDVDLETGAVTTTSRVPLADADIAAAVEAAGYELADRAR